MKILLDTPDVQMGSLIDALRMVPGVKARSLTEAKALLMEEIKEAVDEMKLIKAGKEKARDVEDFLNEL